MAAKGGASLVKVVVYLGLAAALITGVRGLQRRWVRSRTLPPQGLAPRPAPDPPGQDD